MPACCPASFITNYPLSPHLPTNPHPNPEALFSLFSKSQLWYNPDLWGLRYSIGFPSPIFPISQWDSCRVVSFLWVPEPLRLKSCYRHRTEKNLLSLLGCHFVFPQHTPAPASMDFCPSVCPGICRVHFSLSVCRWWYQRSRVVFWGFSHQKILQLL